MLVIFAIDLKPITMLLFLIAYIYRKSEVFLSCTISHPYNTLGHRFLQDRPMWDIPLPLIYFLYTIKCIIHGYVLFLLQVLHILTLLER